MGLNPWKQLASKFVYENAWIRVREDRVLRPDGKPGIYGVVEIAPSIAVLALDAEDRLALVGQWRYTRDAYSWEVPLGGSHHGDADMQSAAARELREETGAVAASWESLGTLQACIGVTTDTQWLYLATELTKLPSRPDPEERLHVEWVPFQQAVDRVLAGDIVECASVASILKLHARRMRSAMQAT